MQRRWVGGGGFNAFNRCSDCEVHNTAANQLLVRDCPAAELNKQCWASSTYPPSPLREQH